MEVLLPHPSMRPSPAKSAINTKPTKLSLRHKLKDKESQKENRLLIQQRTNPTHKSASLALLARKNNFSSLISSDESDCDNKRLLMDSTSLQGVSFSLPKAESTRLEGNFHNDTEQVSFFSCKSKLMYSLSDDDSEGVCEDSIICISDNEEVSPLKLNTELAKQHSAAGKGCPVKQTTVILETSSDDADENIRKHLTGKSILSQLNTVSKKTSEQEWRKTVISSTTTTSSEDEVIESSIFRKTECITAKMDRAFTPMACKSPKQNAESSSSNPNKEVAFAESPESNLQDSREISPRAIMAEKLSVTKIADIKRWLHYNNSSSNDNADVSSDAKNVSPPRSATSGKDLQSMQIIIAESSSDDTFDKLLKLNVRNPQAEAPIMSSFINDSSDSSMARNVSPPHSKTSEKALQSKQTIAESPSSEDSFDKLLKRNVRNPRAKAPLKSSFINDSSSDSSGSFSNYRRVLVKAIKEDTHKVPKTPFGSTRDGEEKTKLKGINNKPAEISSDSSSESDTSSSDWEPGMSTIKKRQKPPATIRRKPKPLILDDSDSEPDNSKRPTGRKKSSEEPKKITVKPKPGAELKGTPFMTPKGQSKKQSKVQELKKEGTPYSPIRTFLTSLSGPSTNPEIRSHPEASIYYKQYKSKKEELARRLYKLYNREVFDSRLPDDMSLEWNARMVSTAGFCSCKMIRKQGETIRSARIVLSTKILDSADRLRDTLIHELCHAAVWLLNNISGGHGPFWKAWADKAQRRFPELPPIKRCHEYQIETKFTYKCTDCGYRHSKSVNLQTQRCGHCFGTFEVLVNKQTRTQNGAPKSTPSTPKPPTGFALFVKDNYGTVKKENKDKKHGDIMKLLGQKFAEVKIKQ